MKRKFIIPIIIGAITIIVSGVLYIYTPKNKINLSISENKLSWINTGENIGISDLYEVYNDEFKIAKFNGNGYVVKEKDLIDTDGPGKISNVIVQYGKDKINIKWDNAEDKGTNNVFSVFMVDENGKNRYISNSEEITYSSGISRYLIKSNNINIDSMNTSFVIERSSLSNGMNYVSVIAQDKRGNFGEEAKIPIYNYPIIINFDGKEVGYHIDDNTQQYDLVAYVNNEKIELGNNIAKVNEYIKDLSAPGAVKIVNVNAIDKAVRFAITPVKEKEQKYSVRLEGTGRNYKNLSFSDEIEVNTASGLKGYYYQINKVPNYTVSSTDIFSNSIEIKKNLDYGDYYLHVASVDNAGNISSTYTREFSVKAPVIEDEILIDDSNSNVNVDINNNANTNTNTNVSGNNNGSSSSNSGGVEELRKGIIYGVDNTSGAMISKASALLDKLPYNIISRLESSNLKIYVTGGSAEKTYKDLTGNSASGITGIFYYSDKTKNVIIEDAYLSSVLYHELGHAVDCIFGNQVFLSSSSEFKNIYEEEKNIIFSSNSNDASSPKEYFAECFNLYFTNRDRLKANAPKTLEYINSIM